jgi:Cu(I)/Ag(I) efflux system membrane fusion protein
MSLPSVYPPKDLSPKTPWGTFLLVALLGAGLGAGLMYRLRVMEKPNDVVEVVQNYQCPMHPQFVRDHPADCPMCGMKMVAMEKEKPAPAQAHKFQCPMHPTVVKDHPADCPICGMKLVPMEEEVSSTPVVTSDAHKFQCPMHPTIVRDQPGDCPICGMKLVPMENTLTQRPEEAGRVEGLAPIKIDPERQQLIGLRTAAATRGPIGGAWRTSGRVVVDETRVHHVNVRFGGFVEKVFADYVGRTVRRGDPLFSIYSPELLAAEQEYVSVLRMREKQGGEALVNATRRKLVLWDLPADDIERIETTGNVERTFTLHSPANGVVVKKTVVPGMSVVAGEMPYEIVDLSNIWVLADVYENEIRHVKVGSPATLTLKAMPGTEYQGKVAFIDPFVDPKTRSVKVRISFSNPGDIKPDMFGEVVLKSPSRQALRVPVDAIIDSGTRSVVFVAQGNGKFLPREVHMGTSDGEMVEIVQGLEEGEKVVTRANFLVDSESRLRASLQSMGGGTSP